MNTFGENVYQFLYILYVPKAWNNDTPYWGCGVCVLIDIIMVGQIQACQQACLDLPYHKSDSADMPGSPLPL